MKKYLLALLASAMMMVVIGCSAESDSTISGPRMSQIKTNTTTSSDSNYDD